MNYVSELRATVERVHHCTAAHTRTESVHELVGGQVIFDGDVEVFALLGHDRALRCYAWGHRDESGRWEATTVLAIPPIVSAATAVLAAVAAQVRDSQREEGGKSDTAGA